MPALSRVFLLGNFDVPTPFASLNATQFISHKCWDNKLFCIILGGTKRRQHMASKTPSFGFILKGAMGGEQPVGFGPLGLW